jgi:hypothetical protein
MTLDTYRAQLAAAVTQAAQEWTEYDVAVEYENRFIVDPEQQQKPFLCVELKFNDGKQADLSAKPRHRLVGFVILTVKVREGEGTAAAMRLLEHFYPRLQHRKIGDMHIEFAKVVTPPARSGWYGLSAMLPFRVDKTY